MLHLDLLPFVALLTFGLAGANGLQKPLTNLRMDPFSPELDTLIEETLKHFHVPGLSIAVIDGKETSAKAYGIAEFPSTKAKPETLYCTGSTTKSFTAAALSLLLDDSTGSSSPLKWTTPISSLIRNDFVLSDEYATSHITLEDALSHRTGMPRHDISAMHNNLSAQNIVRNFRHLPMTAEIRAKFQYCNLMFVTLAHVVESLTGRWLGHFLRTRIWEPLSMSSTFFSLADAKTAVDRGESFARGYFWENISQTYVPEEYIDCSLLSGAGGVISNVLDYSKYLRSMIDQAPPLSPAAHAALRSPRSIMDPIEQFPNAGPTTYAFGWIISSYRGETMVWHDGDLLGYGTLMLYMPWKKWGITMMANTMGTSNAVQRITLYAILDKMFDTPPTDRVDWKRVFDGQLEEGRQAHNIKREMLYPDLPKPPMSLTLPLEQYIGSYFHAGYGVLNLTLNDSEAKATSRSPKAYFCATWVNATIPLVIDFEHVSGEYLLASIALIKADGFRDVQSITKAEYRLNEAGTVDELGIILDAEMGEDKIWFTKVN
ncbi:hypothetical protein MMC07_008096 [Pseudocyphellaria aurata]|nr:hypothetical protein [Pseudocyphellaria aurata]